MTAAIASGDNRVPYANLPVEVHSWVDETLGGRVVSADTQHGGFSPGVAARLTTADGGRAFVKAVSSHVNVESVDLHRREIEVLQTLPTGLPTPRLIASYDAKPWVALLIDDVDGRHPQLPWQDDELDLLFASLREISSCPAGELAPIAVHVEDWRGWRQLAEPGAGDPMHPWARRHLDRLCALEAQADVALADDRLVHSDTRADNVLVAGARAWLVDWPWAGAGPPWFDVVTAAPSVELGGGPGPEGLLLRSRTAGKADAAAVTVLVAAMAGLCLHRATLPPPPGIPTMRTFQAAQGEVALRWLIERTGWA
jgi:aminoglycoside phosphotransferase (APT) family kinase protein